MLQTNVDDKFFIFFHSHKTLVREQKNIRMIMFLMISELNDPLQKKRHQNIHPELIHMTLPNDLVIKDI
jgi:hypothetical protein